MTAICVIDLVLAKDVITTAVEGGINYWAQVVSYNPDLGRAEIIEVGDGEERINHVITGDTVEQALERLGRRVPGLADTVRNHLATELLKSPDECDFDASDADILIQVGLFGKVVYQ